MKVDCRLIGGPSDCPFVVEGSSVEELARKFTLHAVSVHPDVSEDISGMSDREEVEWMNMVKSKVHD